jgi:hypothetical protein
VDHRRPSGVREVDVLDDAAKRMRELGHGQPVDIEAQIPSGPVIQADSRARTCASTAKRAGRRSLVRLRTAVRTGAPPH